MIKQTERFAIVYKLKAFIRDYYMHRIGDLSPDLSQTILNKI